MWAFLNQIAEFFQTFNFFFEFQNFDGPLAPLNGQFIEKVNHYTRTKQMNLSMGPIVIFFLAVLD